LHALMRAHAALIAQWESCGQAGHRIVDKCMKLGMRDFHQQSILR
jgi:hypothetical protein